MEGERSRRKAVVDGRGGKKFKNALAELQELRKTGAKRADLYEVREEEDVYDEVDDDQYARIVQKRREEGGGFVVGDDGLGYTDIGEEIDWVNEDAKASGTTGKKAAKDGAGSKRKPTDQQVPGARARMQKMFQTASVKSRPAKAIVDDKSTEALLDDILGNLDAATPSTGPPVPRVANAAPPTTARATPVAQPPLRVFSRAGGRPSVGTPKNVSFAPLPSTTRMAPTSHRASISRPGSATKPFPRRQPRSYMPESEQDQNMYPGDDVDDDYEPMDIGATTTEDFAPLNEDMTGGDEGDELPQETDPDLGAVENVAAHETPAPTARPSNTTPWRTPAGIAADVATPSTAVPASGWQKMYDDEQEDDENADANIEADDADEPCQSQWQDDGSLTLDDESRLPFYLLDAHEEISQPGTVFLFGKVPSGQPGQYVSCCALVKGVARTLFFVPRDPIGSPEISALHATVEAGGDDTGGDAKKKLVPALHGAFSAVKTEVRALLAKHGVTQMTMKPVLRQYAFENTAVRHGKQWVLKVRCPASQPTLPLNTVGDTFSAVFGANQSSLEALMLKRRVMGPSWMGLKQPRRIDPGAQVSYCQLEVEVDGHKAVCASSDGSRPTPPLTVASVHLKTVINPATSANEVVAASVVYLPRVNTDGPTQFSRREIRHFSAVRKLEGMGFPAGFDAEVKKANMSDVGRRNGGAVLAMQPNERALLTMLVMRLRDIDADVFVGHNFAAFDLDVLLHRMQALKVPQWASLGRLKRSKFPSLGGGGHTFGGGAGAGVMSVVAGRLVCDTYLAARDLVRETEYTLSTLSKNLLGETRCELALADIPGKYTTPYKLLELVHHTESDAWLSLRLAFYLVVLPLTRQLAELSGSLWSKALMNQRAQRIEYLLLHEFHNNKFLLPDKLTLKEKERMAQAAAAADGEDDDAPLPGSKKGGKGPQYAGGLVLEPKKGLYERYVLLLDFNSLYPSIIQEYNICFSTVERSSGEGNVPQLPDSTEERALLPRVIGALVQRRRRVKEMIKGERDAVKKEQLNIRQQALKLLANSMYGCLGFANSRFYAKPIAELITSQGREILQSTVDLVQGSIGREVIYGDTDSIMVNTDSETLADVIALGQAIKKEVNKRYRLLEIEMDGVFKCMLLLKKKKYAAVKVERGADGSQVEAIEAKGLDMVRRDWCPLAKQASQFVLDRILSCEPREGVVAAIHDHLASLAAAVSANEVPLNKFVITKQLTKRPDDYPDAKNQPHVQVALRRRASGKRDGVSAGETVPYVICVEMDESGTMLPREKGLAERAYSPDEVISPAMRGRLVVDSEYYIAQQVFPVVSRLVAPIDGTNAARIAESLGLDPTKYKGIGAGGGGMSCDDALMAAAAGLDDDDRFKDCAPLKLRAPGGEEFEFKGVRSLLKSPDAAESALLGPSNATGGDVACPPGPETPEAAAPSSGFSRRCSLTPAQISNQVLLQGRAIVRKYYEGRLRSDDEMMPCFTRNVCLRETAEGQPGSAPPDIKCSGTMHQEVTEADVYTQLSYLHRLFDVEGALRALGENRDAKLAAEAKLAPIRTALDAGASAAACLRDSSGFRWINLGSVFGRVSA